MNKLIKRENIPYDFWLFITVLLLLVFGSIMVVSAGSFLAEYKFMNKNFFLVSQIKNAGVSIVIFLVAMNFNYVHYKNKYFIYALYAITMFALVYLLASSAGESVKGAKRWIFGFQPSELAKMTVIFFMAFSLNRSKDRLHEYKRGYLLHLGLLSSIVLLVFLQPAFSTSMMIFIIGYLMFYTSGMKLSHLILTFMIALMPAIGYMAVKQPYRLDRIKTFLNPENDTSGKGWQVEQSLIGLGNGGFNGVGLGESRQKEFYLPEPHNDFVFSIIGDEIGFIGTTMVVLAYIIILFRGLKIARNAPDFHGFVLASGITLSVIVYAVFNMGITLGLVPPTGLPLPLISYGGTSLMLTLFSLGVLLNISFKSNHKNTEETVTDNGKAAV